MPAPNSSRTSKVRSARLYVSALGYPLVFGDFAALTAAQLQAYARALPAIGGDWLADASFGWSALVFGSAWPWHRALNVALHAAAVAVAFALFRRILGGSAAAAPGAVATGWIAFFAAALFALHPVAVLRPILLPVRMGTRISGESMPDYLALAGMPADRHH